MSNDTTGQPGPDTPPNAGGNTLTQADVDRIVAERLARQKRQHDEALTAAQSAAQQAAEKHQQEVQAATQAAQAAQEAQTAAERRLAAVQVAIDKGLPVELADRLVGTTPDELAADADRVLALGVIRPAGRPTSTTGLRPGTGTPDDPPEETDPRKLAARLPRY
jgi:anti-sigma28 factor (negative regulator of flagellin synthesis)